MKNRRIRGWAVSHLTSWTLLISANHYIYVNLSRDDVYDYSPTVWVDRKGGEAWTCAVNQKRSQSSLCDFIRVLFCVSIMMRRSLACVLVKLLTSNAQLNTSTWPWGSWNSFSFKTLFPPTGLKERVWAHIARQGVSYLTPWESLALKNKLC